MLVVPNEDIELLVGTLSKHIDGLPTEIYETIRILLEELRNAAALSDFSSRLVGLRYDTSDEYYKGSESSEYGDDDPYSSNYKRKNVQLVLNVGNFPETIRRLNKDIRFNLTSDLILVLERYANLYRPNTLEQLETIHVQTSSKYTLVTPEDLLVVLTFPVLRVTRSSENLLSSSINIVISIPTKIVSTENDTNIVTVVDSTEDVTLGFRLTLFDYSAHTATSWNTPNLCLLDMLNFNIHNVVHSDKYIALCLEK